MAEILPSASYVRSSKSLRDPSTEQAVIASLARGAALEDEDANQIWDLLKTPQTLDSLCRSLGSESEAPIRAVLETLVDEDLIEVSPDS